MTSLYVTDAAQTILVKNDLWEFVNGTKRRPKIVKDDESSLEAAQKWDISDQKAKADLILSISPLELREIKDCETSNEIWLKLASIYESKGPARKAALLKRLILNKLNDEQKMNDFLREFFNCVDRLKAMDMEIADDLLSILLLYAIPDSYENFRIAIESRDELPKPEVLKIKLLEECKARKNREPKHNDAMFARGKLPSLWKGGTQGEALSIKPCSLATAATNKHSDYYSDKASEISLCIEMFLSMKNMKRTLSLANNKSTEIMGTGTANLEILGSDGMTNVKLDNTLYVPDLRSNLLSVAKITEEGFQFIAATDESKVPTLMEWHRRLDHLNERSLLELTRHEKGKQTQSPFPKSQTKRRCCPLELIHTDICGPMRQNSIGGSKYFVTFIDDHSRWCETYFLKNRNEVVDAFMDFKSHAENQTGNKIKTLRSDNATEYCSEKFQKFLRLSLNFWAEAISTACYIRNRCPSRSLNGEIPLTLWNDRKLILNYFRTFGERAYVLGKSPGKGKKVFKSRDVKFTGKFENDETFHQLTAQNQEWPANDTREKENETLELQLTPNESNETDQSGGTLVQNEAEQVTETRKIKVLPGRPRLVRSGRRGRPKKVYQKEEVQPVPCEDVASIVVMNDLKNVTKALSCHESKEWLEAMKREYEALVKNNTWEIVNRLQKQMMADVVTKGLFKSKHEKCISDLGLGNLCGESPKQFNNVGEVLGHIVD
ncbi:Retrovirus-related Pol polyprotein from transposon TNT 1-94 [Trichinella sp. T9]|nr:Retrovirus-related Pol polyprotein from transposon TNT 1-94 [Trichinella sp. T9]